MKKRKVNLFKELLAEMNAIIDDAKGLEKKYKKQLAKVHPKNVLSAKNLLHYRAMRKHDLRDMQKKLRNLGLSRLANAESHILSNVMMTKAILRSLYKKTIIKRERVQLSAKRAIQLQKRNSKDLLGYRSKGRRTRIMVTLPSQAAFDEKLVFNMVKAGMNCCRINCSHDNPEIWLSMINNMHKAEKKLNNKCEITMDLGGPKIRTGTIKEGPEIRKIKTIKDTKGFVKEPTILWLGESQPKDQQFEFIPIRRYHINMVKDLKALYLTDTRNKKRKFSVRTIEENGIAVEAYQTTYIQTGTKLFREKTQKEACFEIAQLLPIENFLLLKKGDYLKLNREAIAGENAIYNETGGVNSIAHISCTSKEIFNHVKEGEVVLFDDGTIKGKIIQSNPDSIIIEIIYTKVGGAKLRADKGINFPSSDLGLKGLTEKDKKDLTFAVKYADTVNMSFVNCSRDVKDLIREMQKLDADNKLGIILKIETQLGYNNLLEILLEGMRIYPLGIMIARGDLAVETGWDNIARIQEEILSLCQSAHIPDIWATQVLENLAKKGIPSRAEISDTVMAQRADCIMLNKGPFILETIELLHTILKEMKPFYDKSVQLTPAMVKVSYHT